MSKVITTKQLQEAADILGLGDLNHIAAINIRPGYIRVVKFILDSQGYKVSFDEYDSEGTYTEQYELVQEEAWIGLKR